MKYFGDVLTAGTVLEGMATLFAADLRPMSDPDFSFTNTSDSRRSFWWLVVLGLMVVMAVVCAATFVMAWNRGLTQAQRAAGGRADRYATSLKSTPDRYEYLLALVALRPFVHGLLASPTPADVGHANRYLCEVSDRVHATAAYTITPSGRALAASNYNQLDSFVGAEYLFRPYFQQAVEGHVGRFYGIGITCEEPGYYISQPVMQDGRVIGMTATKLNLEWFDRASHDASKPVTMADENGATFLSPVPAWQYRMAEPFASKLQAQLEVVHQCYRKQITPLLLQPRASIFLQLTGRLPEGAELIRVGERTNTTHYLQVSHELAEPGWMLMYPTSMEPVMSVAHSVTMAAASTFASAYLLFFYWRQRRLRVMETLRSRRLLEATYDQLGHRVEGRTADLTTTSEQLQHKTVDRTCTEVELCTTQGEFVRASKPTALDQITAGITHEPNQPLAAPRMFSDNTRILLERGQHGATIDNLQTITDLIERMGKTTARLRLFAGRSRCRVAGMQARVALNHMLMLSHPRLGDVLVELHWHILETEAVVRADELKLEQVLTNLTGNTLGTIDANEPVRADRTDITTDPAEGAQAQSNQLTVAVCDNGPGTPPDAMPHLFEPSFTAKEIGQELGLGLAISISIARGFSGSLSTADIPGGGA